MSLGYQNCAVQLYVCCWSLLHSGCVPLQMYLPLCLLQSVTGNRSFQDNSCKKNTKEGLFILFFKAISASLPELFTTRNFNRHFLPDVLSLEQTKQTHMLWLTV